MSERNPAIDPRPGDELRGDPWRYRVLAHEADQVTYEMIMGMNRRRLCICSSVSLSGWRDMAAGLTVTARGKE